MNLSHFLFFILTFPQEKKFEKKTERKKIQKGEVAQGKDGGRSLQHKTIALSAVHYAKRAKQNKILKSGLKLARGKVFSCWWQ